MAAIINDTAWSAKFAEVRRGGREWEAFPEILEGIVPATQKRYANAIMIGRFQPFHIGHLYLALFALKSCDELTIGIGSTQERGTEQNPFGVSTRKAMIRASLADCGVGLDKIRIAEIPDFATDEEWYAYIVKSNGPVNLVISGNPYVNDVFRLHGTDIAEPPKYRRGAISGTRIREMMAEGSGEWKTLVTPSVARIIEKARANSTANDAPLRRLTGA
ncbi:Nicotinamide-nucleotide adenylyltransferase [uncultured archaeon]|nr:Nicotinamide-nucleotide adenylyltransferase [uncultured archaeon]